MGAGSSTVDPPPLLAPAEEGGTRLDVGERTI